MTIGHGLISLLFQTLFQLSPIGSGIDASGQHGDDVGDGEIPFFFVFVPSAADLFFFKEDDAAHSFGEPKICSGIRRLGVGEAVAEGKEEGGTHQLSPIAENGFCTRGMRLHRRQSTQGEGQAQSLGENSED